ncbi:hypothetical protein E1193_03925 [Micromonospora sp. KC606]|nr:hypothetical protein E1193_03925 [Micromonospora sp. KC606]
MHRALVHIDGRGPGTSGAGRPLGGLSRQGPGAEATSRRLLELAAPLPERPRVLDLGCGTGPAALR